MKLAACLLPLLLALLAGLAHAEEAIHVLPGLTVTRAPAALTAGMPWPERAEISSGTAGVWLRGDNNLWRLGARQGVFVLPLGVDSFAQSESGTLVALVDGKIGLVSGRMFLPAFPIPDAEMRLAAGPGDTLHLYGGKAPARILRFDGARVAVLATSPDPVMALTYLGSSVIFATRMGIFSLRPGQPPGLLFPLNEQIAVIALAVNPDTAEIFAATADGVYQLDEGRMTQIAQGLGGALTISGKDILIADPRRKGIFILGRYR